MDAVRESREASSGPSATAISHAEREREAAGAVYAALPETNFSWEVLAESPGRLAVLPVVGVRWSDWGEPDRVLGTLAGIGILPVWAQGLLPVPT